MNANMCPRRRKESPIPCTSCVLPIPDGPWTIAVRSIGPPPPRSFQSSAGKIVGTARTRRRTSRAGRKLLLLAAIPANAFAPGRPDTSGANSAAVVSRARLAMPCAMPRVRDRTTLLPPPAVPLSHFHRVLNAQPFAERERIQRPIRNRLAAIHKFSHALFILRQHHSLLTYGSRTLTSLRASPSNLTTRAFGKSRAILRTEKYGA